jgi:ADP-ribosylation factor GTPase-activating protein 2/3
MAALASKSQSQKIFEKLRTKPANRVSKPKDPRPLRMIADYGMISSYALIVGKRIPHGLQCPSESTSASIARRITATWVSTSPLCDLQTLIVCYPTISGRQGNTDIDTEWQWDQLRIMKVGGNESATKYFQSNGGTAALNSKDPTTKYTANAATKYKEELKRRAAKDAIE